VGGLVRLIGRQKFNRRLKDGLEKSAANRFNATGDRIAGFPINHGNQSNMRSRRPCNYSNEPRFLLHRTLADGGKPALRMGPKPDMKWGSAPDAAPPSIPR